MMAAWKGNMGLVKNLIQHGADANLANKVTRLGFWCSKLHTSTILCRFI